jgi:MHS family proline/betaine transporter-like MFS transporter
MSQQTRHRRVVLAGTIGNVLEWYDFAIYGYFAVQIGRHFFPTEEPIAQMISTFGIFAIGYLMRPIGGVVVGHIGDKLGRNAALTFSIAAMAVPTFVIGILPGYETLGLAAPLLLTLMRMLQGLSVGGEYASSMVFMIEQAPAGRRGLMGGLAGAGATLGTLLGSGVGAALSSAMSPEALAEWGWRIPFLAGLLVGVAGYLLRRHVVEHETPQPREVAPIVETLRLHRRTVLNLVGVTFFHAGSFFIILVYLVSWSQTYVGLSPSRALAINTLSMAVSMLGLIVAGHLSDRLGRKPVMIFACAAALVLALPLFWAMRGAMVWYGHPHFAAGQIVFALLLGLYYGALPALLVELSPPSVRCTTVALGYNLCYGLLGGVSPLVASLLVERTGFAAAPAAWIMVAALVTLVTLLRTRETNPVTARRGGVVRSQ